MVNQNFPALILLALLSERHYTEGWIPRGGNMSNINGQPNRVPSSSSLCMKRRDRKQKKKGQKMRSSNDAKDVDGIGQLASDNYFSYDSTAGLVARLEAMYNYDVDSDSNRQGYILDTPERTKIKSEDWSKLTLGPCVGDCCGNECDEQCDIPEDYKRFANKNAKVDVMTFLGIKRAEPLRVQLDWE